MTVHRKRALAVLASTFASTVTWVGTAGAHPDHLGSGGSGWGHLVTDPYHVGLIVLALGAALGVRRALRRGTR